MKVISSLKKIHLFVARPLEWLIAAILAVMVIIVGYQVFGRYVEALPRIIWTEEVARMGLIWLVMIGAAYAFVLRVHFVIDLLTEKFKAKHERLVETVCLFTVTFSLSVLLVGSYLFFLTGFKRTSTMSGMSMSWSYLSFVVAFIIMWLVSLADLILHLKGERPEFGKYQEEGEE